MATTSLDAHLSYSLDSVNSIAEKIAMLITHPGKLDRSLALKLVDEVQQVEPWGIQPRPATYAISTTPPFESEATLEIKKKCQTLKYTNLLILCLKAKDFRLALEIYDEMKQRDVEVNRYSMNVLLEICYNAALPTKAINLYTDIMKRQPSSLHEKITSQSIKGGEQENQLSSHPQTSSDRHTKLDTYILLINIYTCLGDIDQVNTNWNEIQEKYASLSSVNPSQIEDAFRTRLSSLLKLGYLSLAIDLYEKFGGSWRLDPIVVQMMIQVYSSSSYPQKAIDLLSILQERGVSPSPSTCYRAIESFILENRMKEANDIHMYLIKGLGETNVLDMEKIREIVREKQLQKEVSRTTLDLLSMMEQLEWISPDVKSYERVIDAHARSGNLKMSRLALQGLINETNINPTLSMFESLLLGCIRLHNACFAQEILEQMNNYKEIQLGIYVRLQLLLFHISRFDIQKIESSMKDIFDQQRVDHQMIVTHATEHLWIKVLNFWITQGDLGLKRARELYCRLLSCVINQHTKRSLSIEFYNKMLEISSLLKDDREFTRILSCLKHNKYLPSIYTLQLLMDYHLRQMDHLAVIRTYHQVLDIHLVPNLEMGKILIKSLGISQLLQDQGVSKFFELQLLRYHWPPGADLLEAIQKACQESKIPQLYHHYVRVLCTKYDLKLQSHHYISWLSACLEFGDLNEAFQLCHKLLEIAEKDPNKMKKGFPAMLSLYISKFATDKISNDSLEQWIVDPKDAGPLTKQERAMFKNHVKIWTEGLFETIVEGSGLVTV